LRKRVADRLDLRLFYSTKKLQREMKVLFADPANPRNFRRQLRYRLGNSGADLRSDLHSDERANHG
jgi:hypothetical protein